MRTQDKPRPIRSVRARERVRVLQRALLRLGYEAGEVDGMAGPRTRHALRTFQQDRGLLADGEAGLRTLRYLKHALQEAELPQERQIPLPFAPVSLPTPLREALRALAVDAGAGWPRADGELGLVGVRGWLDGRIVPNRFDRYNDTLYLLPGSREEEGFACRASVDPGKLREPNPRGVAQLLPGLYRYRLGLHRGDEPALVQAGPVRVRRQFAAQQPGEPAAFAPYSEEGWFGINVHRGGLGEAVGEWSAGCQVVHGSDWQRLIRALQQAHRRGQQDLEYLLLEGDTLAGMLERLGRTG